MLHRSSRGESRRFPLEGWNTWNLSGLPIVTREFRKSAARFAGLFAALLALSPLFGPPLRAQSAAATNANAGAVVLLPPVSISTGIWLQRGFEQERARLRSEMTGLQEELLRNAREQKQMSLRLREAEDRLRLAGEEAVRAQSMAKEIAGAKGELEQLRKAMTELETQSISKEREYVMKLESAAGERARG